MDTIPQRLTPNPGERATAIRALTQAVGADPDAFSAAVLETLDRLDLPWSVKEVATGRYLQVSSAMAEAFGHSPSSFTGLTDTDLMDAAKAAAVRAAEQVGLTLDASPPGELRLELAGGRREFRVVRTALAGADGSAPRHLLTVWLETTGARRREEQLQAALAQLESQQRQVEQQRADTAESGLRDDVTGLYRHVHFDDQLRREVDLSSREHREFALVVISIDAPQAQATALGEPARARVLEALGQLLRGNTRAMDASCRLDDDRFACLLSGVGLATAHSRMEGLRRQCATQILVLEGRDFGFTVSMGVASFPHTAHTEETLLEAADNARLEACRRGGNHVTLASIRFQSARA